jgi:hypothetical protein
MEWILVKGNEINLNFEQQTSPTGRKFRYSGIRKNEDVVPIWVDRVEKYHWIYSFIYLDNDEIFEFEADFFDKVIRKL